MTAAVPRDLDLEKVRLAVGTHNEPQSAAQLEAEARARVMEVEPVKTAGSNHNYGAPPGLEHEVDGLPCRVDSQTTTSIWQLTDDERRFIVDGGNIALTVWGHPHPVVALAVTGEQAIE